MIASKNFLSTYIKIHVSLRGAAFSTSILNVRYLYFNINFNLFFCLF